MEFLIDGHLYLFELHVLWLHDGTVVIVLVPLGVCFGIPSSFSELPWLTNNFSRTSYSL